MASRKAATPGNMSIDSTSVQDYVKAIYAFTEWQEAPITASRLAARLSVANSSVTEMVRKLVDLGLAEHQKYSPIRLTAAGRSLALVMVRRHRLVETFLVEELGYRWDEVHDEAELLEHTVSDAFIERLDVKLGRPARDPHGDPIPTAEGRIRLPSAVPVSLLDTGHACRVARISDENPEVLRFFAAHAVGLDTPLVVRGRRPFDGALVVAMNRGEPDSAFDLGAEPAGALWVESLGTHPGCTFTMP